MGYKNHHLWSVSVYRVPAVGQSAVGITLERSEIRRLQWGGSPLPPQAGLGVGMWEHREEHLVHLCLGNRWQQQGHVWRFCARCRYNRVSLNLVLECSL